MTAYEDIYNSLPTVYDAHRRFIDRENTLAKLAPLLAKFQYQFSVCLVHAHCKVERGEKMIATGDVTQPEDVESFSSPYYPERWLSTGEPYEFTTTPTSNPPAELLSEFHKVVRETGVLGLSFVGTPRVGSWVERTVGRRNIMERETDTIRLSSGKLKIQTIWHPKLGPDGTQSVPGGNSLEYCVHCNHCEHCEHCDDHDD